MQTKHRIQAAKRDYDWGFERPIELCRIVLDGTVELDSGQLPAVVGTKLGEMGIGIGEGKVRVIDLSLVWEMDCDRRLLMKYVKSPLRGNKGGIDEGGVLTVYDRDVTERIREPTYEDVSNWHCITYSYLANVGSQQGWKRERDERLKKADEEARIVLRRRALRDRISMYDKHMYRHDRLQDLFDGKLDRGEVDVTVRDVMSSMQLQERETRAMVAEEQRGGDVATDFIRLLAQIGLIDKLPEKIVDAEVVAIESGETDSDAEYFGDDSESDPDGGSEAFGEEEE